MIQKPTEVSMHTVVKIMPLMILVVMITKVAISASFQQATHVKSGENYHRTLIQDIWPF